MDPSTRFADDAIRRILNRAAARQEQADRALPAADRGSRSGPDLGLTLGQLQEVAGEVGPKAIVAPIIRSPERRPVAGDAVLFRRSTRSPSVRGG